MTETCGNAMMARSERGTCNKGILGRADKGDYQVNVVSTIQMGIIHEPFPTHIGARLLKIDPHDDVH